MPRTIPPADIAVRYVSAAASARIGGDLYEAVPVGGGVRLIVGDVLGKGLPAARTAAVVLGAFRESAYDAVSLAEIAARIEASLQHQEAVEEFVTVVLAQVSADGSQAEILNCGHPPPLLVRDGEVTAAEPAAVSLPLGLGALLPEAREVSTIPLKTGDRLLFYTDGITEARDRQGTFYPLELSGALLSLPDLGSALDQLIEDVLRHVGHTLQDDAAILLIGLEQPVSAAPPAGQTPGGSRPLSPRQGGRAPGARTSRVGPAPALKPAEDRCVAGLLVAAAVTGMAWLATQMSSLAPWTFIKQLFSILNMRIAKDDLRAAAVIRETAMRLFAERGARR